MGQPLVETGEDERCGWPWRPQQGRSWRSWQGWLQRSLQWLRLFDWWQWLKLDLLFFLSLITLMCLMCDELWVTNIFACWAVTILPYFFTTVYSLGLKGGVGLLNLCCFTSTGSPGCRLDICVCLWLSAYSFTLVLLTRSLWAILVWLGSGVGLGASGRPMFEFSKDFKRESVGRAVRSSSVQA